MSKITASFQTAFRQRHTLITFSCTFVVLLILALLLAPTVIVFLSLALLVIVVAMGIAWALAKPLAIYLYIRSIRAEERQNSRIYIPLSALRNMYETPVLYRDSERHQKQDVSGLIKRSTLNIMLLGLPGAGKTVALRAYQYSALQDFWKLLFGKSIIPLYIMMREYNVYLHMRGITTTTLSPFPQVTPTPATPADMLSSLRTLLNYLMEESDQPGIKYLRPYLEALIEQRGILFLCDGLNEIDSNWLKFVSWELMFLMKHAKNKVVMTCRELDYRQNPELSAIVEQRYADEALILPLDVEQIKKFVVQYSANSDDEGKPWQYNAQQINEKIERGNLSYNCTNPMMLRSMMHVINNNGLEQGSTLDTRGRLLKNLVVLTVRRELPNSPLGYSLQEEELVIRFLSYIAFTARRVGFRNAIQLDNFQASGAGSPPRALPLAEQAALLQSWLDSTNRRLAAPGGAYALQVQGLASGDIERYLDFAQSAALLTISRSNILSFRHELIAEYFVAEHLRYLETTTPGSIPFASEIAKDLGPWSEPVALWAGMLSDPMELARKFANLGAALAQSNSDSSYNALALCLVCAGTTWLSPKAAVIPGRQCMPLPPDTLQLIQVFSSDESKRRELAKIITRSAKEGGIEVYRSLLPMLIDGNTTDRRITDLMLLLDREPVLTFLYDNLRDTVDIGMADPIQNLVRILGHFGDDAVIYGERRLNSTQATNLDLRAKILEVLGRTGTSQAVTELIRQLESDIEKIQFATVNALVTLGPGLALDRILESLRSHVPISLIPIIHWNALHVCQGFLSDPRGLLNDIQYGRMVETLLLVLAFRDPAVPDQNYAKVREKTSEIITQQALPAQNTNQERWKTVIAALIQALNTEQDDKAIFVMQTLKVVGKSATPSLQVALRSSRVEIALARLIKIIGAVRDEAAIPDLLTRLGDSYPIVQKEAAAALLEYAPASVDPLIDAVLRDKSDPIAQNAVLVLITIGTRSVTPIVNALNDIVPKRTELLINALVTINDARAITPLIGQLAAIHQDTTLPQIVVTSLVVCLIRALGQFNNHQVVPPLIKELLHSPQPFNQEAQVALSGLGPIAIDGLVTAMELPADIQQDQQQALYNRISFTLLKMEPFPAPNLLNKFATSSDVQAQRLVEVFFHKIETVPFLVNNLGYPNDRVRKYVRAIIDKLSWEQLKAPLLDALASPGQLEFIKPYLLTNKQSIPDLVCLLDDATRREGASSVLFAVGTGVIPFLAPATAHGLKSENPQALQRAQGILVALVRQEKEREQQQRVAAMIVDLFASLIPPQDWNTSLSNVWGAVFNILLNDLADVSIDPLIAALADGQKQTGAVKALVRLVRLRGAQSERAKQELLKALEQQDRRGGAQAALIELDEEVVQPVSKLLTHSDQAVQQAAQHILKEIGPAAFPFIWDNYRNETNPELREAAIKIFRTMSTEKVKISLVQLLTSTKSRDVEMAIVLLTERILVENNSGQNELLPTLLEHIQHHAQNTETLRVIGLLFMQRKDLLVRYLAQALKNPGHEWWLPYLLLPLGLEGPLVQAALEEIIQGTATYTAQTRSDAAALMGLLRLDVSRLATSLRKHGKATIQFTQQPTYQATDRDVSLRALGGLLAGGKWNGNELQARRNASRVGSEEHDLFSVLLGEPLGARIDDLNNQLGKALQDSQNQQENINTLQGKVNRLLREKRDQDRLVKDLQQQLQAQQQTLPPQQPYP